MEDPQKPPPHQPPQLEFNPGSTDTGAPPPMYRAMQQDPNAGLHPPGVSPQYHPGPPPPPQPYPQPPPYQQPYGPPPSQPVVGVPQPSPVYSQGNRETYVGPLTLAVAILPGILCCFWCSVLILACPIDERPAPVVVHMAPPQQQMMYQQSPPPPPQQHY